MIYCGLINTLNQAIGIMVKVFANGLGDRGSIQGQVIPKTQKMVLDAALLSTQHYKVRIKVKVELLKEEPLSRPQLRLPTTTTINIFLCFPDITPNIFCCLHYNNPVMHSYLGITFPQNISS